MPTIQKILLAIACAALLTSPAAAQPSMLEVQVQEMRTAAGSIRHRVSVYPAWGRRNPRGGPMFGADVGMSDLFVYVPDPDFTPARDQNSDTKFVVGFQHASGRIPWGTARFTTLKRGEPFCSRIRELPVSQMTELQAQWLGNKLDCRVNREVSRRQPVGLRTCSCMFR